MKIKVIGLIVIAAFFSVSCQTLNKIKSNSSSVPVSSILDSSTTKSNSSTTKSDSSASKGEGWNQNADGSWTSNPGKGRAIPKADPNLTTSFYVYNRLGSGEYITGLWIMSAVSSSTTGWGDNLIYAGRELIGGESFSIPLHARNKENKFHVRAVTKKGETFTLSNIVIAPNGTVEIRR
ncbi:MAG: hypothetical protein FWF73_07575 [Spirochaetes bacterium]|nr:hypothetical protein [Spirochaetota bacterium]